MLLSSTNDWTLYTKKLLTWALQLVSPLSTWLYEKKHAHQNKIIDNYYKPECKPNYYYFYSKLILYCNHSNDAEAPFKTFRRRALSQRGAGAYTKSLRAKKGVIIFLLNTLPCFKKNSVHFFCSKILDYSTQKQIQALKYTLVFSTKVLQYYAVQ